MKVLVFNQQKDIPLSLLSVKSAVREVLAAEQCETDEVAVYFVSTQEICRLHAGFFNDPSPTDCISFPIDGQTPKEREYHVLGEIFICPQAAYDFLATQEGDVYTETTLYLVHGLLHLLGYDDIEESAQKTMRSKEQKHLKNLESKNLILKGNLKRSQ